MTITSANRLNGVSEYYFATKLREVRQLQDSGKAVINLGIGNPDLQPSDKVIRMLQNASGLDGSHSYQPYKGIPALRYAFTKWYKRVFDVDIHPEHELLPLMGSKEGLMHISMAFTNPGDRVLVPDPGYPAYTAVSKLLDLQITTYDLLAKNSWQPNIQQIEELCDERTKLLWLNYPHMPSGARANPVFYKKLIALARKRNILLINDNPYSLTNYDVPISILQFSGITENVLELNSLSKSHHMPGFRIGCVSGTESNINRILQVKSNFDSGMYLPLQLAAVEALDTELNWHLQQNRIYKKRQDLIFQLCEKLGCKFDSNSVGLFVWAEVPQSYKDEKAFADHLLYNKDVFVAPGSIFGKNGKGYIRISLCQPEKELTKLLKRI